MLAGKRKSGHQASDAILFETGTAWPITSMISVTTSWYERFRAEYAGRASVPLMWPKTSNTGFDGQINYRGNIRCVNFNTSLR